MSDHPALNRAIHHAESFLASLDARPVAVSTPLSALREALDRELENAPIPPERVIDELARDIDAGLLGSTTGRFFGWVIGGALPASLAADWLASTWDQNAAMYAVSPGASVVEETAGRWLKDVLRLPADASFAFVTGCQMAHVTALAAARHRLLADRGWNTTRQGLAGAPQIRVLTSALRHESLNRAVTMLGIGLDHVELVPMDADGRMSVPALADRLRSAADVPTIVSLAAGDLNRGIYDPFAEVCPLARAAGAWVHVDGAFGLWAAASPRLRHLVDGIERADSWATDGHKWLNVPFDNGIVFVADPDAHRAALTTHASYFVDAPDTARDPMWYNPEWSRRSRGIPVYAALRSLGRDGLARMIERSCEITRQLVDGIDAMDGAEKVVEPIINQGLVRFLAADGDHDRRTDEVIERIRAGGEAWFGGSNLDGKRVMRISVCNYRTTDDDVQRTLRAIARALER